MRRICHWTVPIDDNFHPIGTGDIRYVGSKQHDDQYVHVWTEEYADSPPTGRLVRVFGTGHPVPETGSVEYRGTTVNGTLVWHLFEMMS